MSDATVTDIRRIEAPYRREVLLQNVLHESGMTLLRVRIREGHRFTILDIDAATAEAWAGTMLEWARLQASPSATVVVPDDNGDGGSAVA